LARTKINLVYSEIAATIGTRATYFEKPIDLLLNETMWPVFEHKGDAMPPNRTKVVH
jgi:hypothetical protein